MPTTSSSPPLALLLFLACSPGSADTDTDTTNATEATEPQPTTDDVPTSGPETDGENPAGQCSPVDGSPCPSDYICCSDDPATVGGKTPNYFNPGVVDDVYDTPLFSGDNNDRSRSGQCIETGGFVSPFASGCPVPCNPRWDKGRQDEICGTTAICCQFTELDPDKDCVLDPDTNKWRAVTGEDIPELTNWGPLHTTNQDPTSERCIEFATDGSNNLNEDLYDDCIEQLSVADQRGFCYSPDLCPCREDLCDMKNPGYVAICG